MPKATKLSDVFEIFCTWPDCHRPVRHGVLVEAEGEERISFVGACAEHPFEIIREDEEDD